MPGRRRAVASAARALVFVAAACKAPSLPDPIALDAGAPRAPESVMPSAPAPPVAGCVITRVLDDGSLDLLVDGRAIVARLEGVAIRPGAGADVMAVLGRVHRPPRCDVRLGDAGPARVVVEIYGWQDKSGDVWLDLGDELVKVGLASPRSAAPR
jgi:hypothetical protein